MPRKETKQENTFVDYTPILNKIFISLIILIILLITNTTLLLVSIGDINTKGNDTQDTQSSAEYDVSMFEEVDAAKYAELYKKDELVVTYFGRSDCGYCIQFLPSMQKAQKEYGFKTRYVDINKLDQSSANIIFALNEKFNDTLGRTPMITVTKNGELINIQMGAASYESYVKFLKDNGVIK